MLVSVCFFPGSCWKVAFIPPFFCFISSSLNWNHAKICLLYSLFDLLFHFCGFHLSVWHFFRFESQTYICNFSCTVSAQFLFCLLVCTARFYRFFVAGLGASVLLPYFFHSANQECGVRTLQVHRKIWDCKQSKKGFSILYLIHCDDLLTCQTKFSCFTRALDRKFTNFVSRDLFLAWEQGVKKKSLGTRL